MKVKLNRTDEPTLLTPAFRKKMEARRQLLVSVQPPGPLLSGLEETGTFLGIERFSWL